jgi:hypothetical protein
VGRRDEMKEEERRVGTKDFFIFSTKLHLEGYEYQAQIVVVGKILFWGRPR